jgi:hypothetical protein
VIAKGLGNMLRRKSEFINVLVSFLWSLWWWFYLLWEANQGIGTSSMGIVRAQSQAASDDAAVASVPTTFKHLLLPIMDKNPYLSAATQQVQNLYSLLFGLSFNVAFAVLELGSAWSGVCSLVFSVVGAPWWAMARQKQIAWWKLSALFF